MTRLEIFTRELPEFHFVARMFGFTARGRSPEEARKRLKEILSYAVDVEYRRMQEETKAQQGELK